MAQKTKKQPVKAKKPVRPEWQTKVRDFLMVLVPQSKWGRRIAAIFYGGFIGILLIMFAISQWYISSHRSQPLEIGATFIPNYARYFDLDPKETMQAMIDDLGIRRFRLVTYWNNHEKEPGEYDFSELDWQFDKVEAAGGTVSLALGLRQPRWPECHGPEWAMAKPIEQWREDLKDYMGVIIDRYKDRDVLTEYQLENEYFLSVFGDCPDHSRERLVDEYNYVKEKDSSRPLIVSRSNNATPSWPIGEPRADKVAASIYKRVYDNTITKRYYEYPYPAWFYGFLAGATQLTTDRDTIIHELQTEAWLPEEYQMPDAPIEELYKTFSPETLKDRLRYGVDTGIRTIDVWGVEWWYQMKTQRNAPELWDTAKTELEKYRQLDQ